MRIFRPRLRIRSISLAMANLFVTRLHRHHKRVRGHRFSIQAIDQFGRSRGVATDGRAVGRCAGKPEEVLEVTRLCTDGCRNACSFLYAAAARAGRELGYLRIQTYILSSEDGLSLKAAGWKDEGPAGGGLWKHYGKKETRASLLPISSVKIRKNDHPLGRKRRWAKELQCA